jgi:hypothetical protein
VALPDDHSAALQTVVLKVQENALHRRWRYYIGQHDRIWATPKLQETFRDLADAMVENYCGIAINQRVSRLQVEGWEGDTRAESIWDEAGLPQRQDVLFRWGLTYGTVYLIVQDDQIAVNPPTVAYSQTDPNDWLRQAWAGKAWLDIDSGEWHATLWDESTIYRYKAQGNIPYTPNETLQMYSPAGVDFDLIDTENHGYNQVPVVPCLPFGFQAAPLIDQIKPIQDKINKLSANKFVAAEFGAFKQRIFFTRQELDPYQVRQQPDHAIVLDPGDSEGRASVQELGGAELHGFDEAKDREIEALFTIANLPRHLRVGSKSQLSAEAMKTDENPFLEALADHQREFGEGIQQALSIMEVDAEPIWRDTSPRDEHKNAQTVDLLVRAGLPWQTAVSMFMGMTPEEIETAEKVLTDEASYREDLMGLQTTQFLTNPLMSEE